MSKEFEDFYVTFCKEVSAVCHAYVRLMVISYFEKHNYYENCQFWDKLNHRAQDICADLSPYSDPRYVSVSELRNMD